MNIVLDGHIKLLEPQYNMLTSIYIFGYDEIIKMKKASRILYQKSNYKGKEKAGNNSCNYMFLCEETYVDREE